MNCKSVLLLGLLFATPALALPTKHVTTKRGTPVVDQVCAYAIDLGQNKPAHEETVDGVPVGRKICW